MDWNLVDSHSTADVHWPDPQLEAVDIRPISLVRIRFPGGRTFRADTGIRRVALERDGASVSSIVVFSEPRSVADAYELAHRWAREWNLPREPLDSWYRRGGRDHNVVAVGPPGRTVGKGGPEPSIKLLASFEDAKPTIVSLSFDY